MDAEMNPQRTQPASPAGLSTESLSRLLAEKEREHDARLAFELTSRREQMAFQEALAECLGRVTDECELAGLVVRRAQEALGATDAVLALVGESQFLEVAAASMPAPHAYQVEFIEEAFIVGETLAVAGSDSEALQVPGSADLPAGVALVATPLMGEGGLPLGVLLLEGELRPGREAWLAELAGFVARAIEDCRLYNRIEGPIMDAVLAIAEAHEAKTPHQAGHARRVASLAEQLGLALGLAPTWRKHLRWLALLHDLTPEAIREAFSMIRRGDVSEADWQKLMAEPFGAGVYPSPLANFQRVVEELRLLKSRWDGKGNQPAVAGDEIPVTARIVAVAEAFDNLTGFRAHRTTLGIPQAVAALARYGGAQYDPTVVDALKRLYAQVELEVRIAPALPDAS